jgi:hypothetical protein
MPRRGGLNPRVRFWKTFGDYALGILEIKELSAEFLKISKITRSWNVRDIAMGGQRL